MSEPLRVDPDGVRAAGTAVAAMRGRLAVAAAPVPAWSRWASSGPASVPALGAAMAGAMVLRRVAEALAGVEALARVLTAVAESFARTEAGVAASFGSGGPDPASGLSGGDLRGVAALLNGLDPGPLEALLVGCPLLARWVVDRLGADPGSTAARLSAVMRSGEPVPLRLAAARDLLLALPDAERERLALLHPALVSGLASAPVASRFAATRVLVSAESARLRAELPGLSAGRRVAAGRRLAWYDELLTGRVVLTRPDGTRLVRRHQLLSFDARGDGRIAEVFGDPEQARHLAVYVPGTGTSFDRYPHNAIRVRSFAAAQPDLAVVLWQNADFPDQPQDDVLPPTASWDRPVQAAQEQLRTHVLAAAYRDAADRAGPLLATDVEGLRMALPGPAADLTVLGHSYGGSVVGSAETRGMVVDRVVHIASAGGYASDVRSYAAGECGTRRFSMTDPDDPIQLVQGAGLGSAGQVGHSLLTVQSVLPWPLKPLALPLATTAAVVSGAPSQVGHGLDPDLIPGVTRLDTGVLADGHTLVSGHGGMFAVGSGAWRNLLAVMHGDPVRVLEPARWHSELVPSEVDARLGPHGLAVTATAAHYVVTRSPYGTAGYQPPVQSSVEPVCSGRTSW